MQKLYVLPCIISSKGNHLALISDITPLAHKGVQRLSLPTLVSTMLSPLSSHRWSFKENARHPDYVKGINGVD